jgi:hypothetical protein
MAAGAFVAGGLPVAATSAAPAWLPPVNLAEEHEEVRFGPFVAMDAQGDALAVWDGGSATNETFRPAGGSWQTPGSLAAEHPDVGGRCVAVSPAGEALALRSISNGRGPVIQAVMKPPGDGWEPPVDVEEESAGALRMTDCHVAIDSAGDAVAVWSFETEFEFEPVWAAYKPAGGGWMAPVELRPPLNPAASPDVAIDSRGDAQAVWIGNSFVIQGVYKPAGQDWREPASVTEVESLSEKGHSAISPRVAFDSQGDAVATWDLGPEYTSAEETFVVQAASRPAGGMWGAPVDLSPPDRESFTPSVAMDAQGDALAVWDLHSGEERIVQSTTRLAGGDWQSSVDLSQVGENAYSPDLAMDAQGDAVAAWEVERGKDWSVQSVAKPAGEGWQAPVSVSQVTEHGNLFPQVVLDSRGDALAAWELNNGSSYLIQAAGYQAAGPQLDGLAIPSTGTAGESVGFSVSPLDVWAALGTTRWSFGDGDSATGTSVTHTYAAGGAYPVTLTGEDALGNTSSATGTITISSAPSTPTPTPRLTLTPPTITAAGQSASIWREGSRLASLARKQKPPIGTTFSFALNERASVSFAFTQRVAGRTVNGKCVAQSKKRRHKSACKPTVTAGTLSFIGHAGTNKVSFQGRISSAKRLAPGRYTLVVTATNAAGQRSNTNLLRFTIVK